ncbi:uncharacterized protein LOC108451376 [Gossypium arboreum]|uniref:uncharacterized protein LOC108451376 n=1 Tax=Gossypium arboreum TaxID=29729 RepID=UPI0008196DF3|nr:uncharacterized protein LOC108451376 [Gossypium arboreum]
MTLQLGDRSLAQLEGKIKDVFVCMDKFIFSADFIMLDYEADREISIILEQLFLATGRTLIDVYKSELTMRLNDEPVTFSVFESIDKEECHTVDVLDDLIEEEFNDESTILSKEFAMTFDAESLDDCDNMVEANNLELKHGW